MIHVHLHWILFEVVADRRSLGRHEISHLWSSFWRCTKNSHIASIYSFYLRKFLKIKGNILSKLLLEIVTEAIILIWNHQLRIMTDESLSFSWGAFFLPDASSPQLLKHSKILLGTYNRILSRTCSSISQERMISHR